MSRARALLAFHAVRSEGGLLPYDMLQRIALEDKSVPGLTPDAYHLDPGDRFRDATNRAWTRLSTAWRAFRAALAKLPETDPATTVTRERWLLPLFDVLGYGRLAKTATFQIYGKGYAISHAWHCSPIHLLGCRVGLDVKQKGVAGASAASPHGLVQEFLNRSSGHLWGFVSNGHVLRVLRDHHSLTQQAYVEFDLEAIFEGEAFSEFVLLYLVCQQSRVEADKPEECWLEQWFATSRDEGVRALDKLRKGVENAIAALGTGFLRHKANKALHAALETGALDKQDYYRQLLRLAYRLIFLFVAEDRGALLDPSAPDDARARYERFYTTKRLRDLADRRRGGPHGDLWNELRLVIGKLWNGSPELGLPALGSFLWKPSSTRDLNGLELANEDLLKALKALCYVEQGRTRYAVSWRNIGAEELGSVYESLLELHPDIHKEAGRFELSSAAGHERKTTGSYYTPTSLVDCLLDSALDPVLDEAAKKADAEKAILDLKVCDPACGSGHFLVAAARRMAVRLASVRAGGDEPSPPEVQRALRDVVGRCIYGVDLNPMAVELCKVSLWMEAIEPGKPLSFLDAHIQQGNALLGATPALMAKGIPDEAFEAIEGDDKEVAKRLKKRNKKARETGQLGMEGLFAQSPPGSYYGRISIAAGRVELDRDDDIVAVRKKEEDWEQVTGSVDYLRGKALADAWCAAFVWTKQKGALEDGAVTEDLWRRLEKDFDKAAPPAMKTEVQKLAREYSFFHWHLAFPQVLRPKSELLASDDPCGWNGGFDLVLGNPPWDTLSPDAKEFFSLYDARVRFQSKGEQDVSISKMLRDDVISAAWARNRRNLFATAFFLKDSGRYTLFAPGNLGKGDFNIYRMFVEVALRSVRAGGWAAQIVPDGLYSGANSMALRKQLFEHFRLDWILGFENARETWFAGVDSRAKFTLYSARSGSVTEQFRAAFCIRSPDNLRAVMAGANMELPIAMVREFSPDALAVMEFRQQRDIDIARKMYERWSPLGQRIPGTAHRDFLRELESGHVQEFLTEERSGLPHYEGRMIDQYDYRAKGYRSGRARAAVWEDLPFGSADKSMQPQWYVPRDKVPAQARERIDEYRVGFCDVASPTNERTLVASVIPPGCIAGDKVPTVLMRSHDPAADLLVWLAVANSFTMDFLVRMKVSLKMALTILDSLPFPRLPREHAQTERIVDLAARLTCTGPEMRGYWDLLAKDKWLPELGPSDPLPGLVDHGRRLTALAEIEAIVARDLYGLTRDELSYIMDTFPIVEKRDIQKYGSYRTKELVLAEYDHPAQPVDPRVADPPVEET